MIVATAFMASGVTLVELPCTIGFPMIWTSLVAQQDIGMTAFISLLALYLVIFLLDEILIFVTAVVSLRVERLQEKQGRVLKLFGGVLMLTLGIAMLVRPSLMRDLTAALGVFLIAGLVAMLILFVHRSVHQNH
jgi:cytochrome c biogenesis protein CcdA